MINYHDFHVFTEMQTWIKNLLQTNPEVRIINVESLSLISHNPFRNANFRVWFTL